MSHPTRTKHTLTAAESQALHAWIQEFARELGFFAAGFAPAEPVDQPDRFLLWLEEGRHGEMAYLARSPEVRLDPRRFVPGARSIIALIQRHADDADELGLRGGDGAERPRGRVARYAWGRDYHRAIRTRLHRISDGLRSRFPHHEFRSTVDTAPLMEREHARRAGLGFIGKHTLLIHPHLGSWFLIGCIVTTLDLLGDHPMVRGPQAEEVRQGEKAVSGEKTEAEGRTFNALGQPGFEGCGTCTRCIDACPTGCIDPAGYRIDASRCISYLTLEHRSAIDPAMFAPMGDWLAGCDVCQEVCPFNQPSRPVTRRTRRDSPLDADSLPRKWALSLDLLEVLNWTEADRQANLAGSALMRMKLPMIQRNAIINAGHVLKGRRDDALLERLRALADSDNPCELTRRTAREVLAQRNQAGETGSAVTGDGD
ncbi:MAG: DUF1730 domain-containing protein [Phycisphaeraceae bacterium]|nr:DUF1730 domain-containing protein [Phycisphaeraceae bacterium]